MYNRKIFDVAAQLQSAVLGRGEEQSALPPKWYLFSYLQSVFVRKEAALTDATACFLTEAVFSSGTKTPDKGLTKVVGGSSSICLCWPKAALRATKKDKPGREGQRKQTRSLSSR